DVITGTGVTLGDRIKPTHGLSGRAEDEHEETWEVVGILEQTGTAADRMVYIPLISSFAVPEHESAIVTLTAIQQGLTPEEAARLLKTFSAEAQQDEAEHDHEGEEEHV